MLVMIFAPVAASAFRSAIGFWNEPCASNPSPGVRCRSGAIYAGSYGGSKYMTTPGGCSNSSTPTCTGIDTSKFSQSDAITYCDAMVYGGFSDWYLPSENELGGLLYPNRAAIGGFQTSLWDASYMSSTTGSFWGFPTVAREVDFSTGSSAMIFSSAYVRCVRKL